MYFQKFEQYNVFMGKQVFPKVIAKFKNNFPDSTIENNELNTLRLVLKVQTKSASGEDIKLTFSAYYPSINDKDTTGKGIEIFFQSVAIRGSFLNNNENYVYFIDQEFKADEKHLLQMAQSEDDIVANIMSLYNSLVDNELAANRKFTKNAMKEYQDKSKYTKPDYRHILVDVYSEKFRKYKETEKRLKFIRIPI